MPGLWATLKLCRDAGRQIRTGVSHAIHPEACATRMNEIMALACFGPQLERALIRYGYSLIRNSNASKVVERARVERGQSPVRLRLRNCLEARLSPGRQAQTLECALVRDLFARELPAPEAKHPVVTTSHKRGFKAWR